MPPKIKTDRATIIDAAFEVARDFGMATITAQSVAKILGTSVAPIFREFQSVDELRTATLKRIDDFHSQYLKKYKRASSEDSQFLTYGLAYIQFAKEYPNLFETIMLPSISELSKKIMGSFAFVLESVSTLSGLSVEKSEELFLHVWIYTHGIACLVYKKNLPISAAQEKEFLLDAFASFLNYLKS